MARVQFGHGAVRVRVPDEGVGDSRRPSTSAETGRSWKVTRRPDTESITVVESVGRMRQPQWAQKLWFESRSLVRPQLAQRATGFFLFGKSVRYEKAGVERRYSEIVTNPSSEQPAVKSYG